MIPLRLTIVCLCGAWVLVKCDIGLDLSNGYNYPQPPAQSGYSYPQPVNPLPIQPLPPIQFDEPSTPSNSYLPPPIIEDELPPFQPPNPTYLPPYPPIGSPPPSVISNDDTVVIPAAPPSGLYQSPQLKIVNMSCIIDNYFRSTIRMEGRSFGLPAPVIDDAPEGCLIAGPDPNTFQVNMAGIKMTECGVKKCAVNGHRVNMCVTVRMPTVRNLKLPEDSVVTLQCAPQDNIVSHVRHLRLGANNIIAKGRSAHSNYVATGGTQRNFNTRVLLLRKSNGNVFDQVIQPGSTVQLGEDLVLKAQILDGDGWQYSRMGGVVVRSSSSQKALTLVEENGCRSPGLRSICPHQPRQMTPLISVLNFRAFLFQGASKGDEMVLSVRMIGCLHSRDCFQRSCEESGRFKRSPALNKSKERIDNDDEAMNWDTLEFRVVPPTSEQRPSFYKSLEKDFKSISGQPVSHEFIILASLFSLFVFVVLILYLKRKFLV